jgi:hypothetical protein
MGAESEIPRAASSFEIVFFISASPFCFLAFIIAYNIFYFNPNTPISILFFVAVIKPSQSCGRIEP